MTEHLLPLRPLPLPLPLPRARSTSWIAAAVAFATLTVAPDVLAQDRAIENEFTVQRFNPAPGPRNYFTTRGARTEGEMSFSAGLFLNYAYRPFMVRSCESETNCDDPNAIRGTDVAVVESMVTADVLASLTPIPRLQLGLRIPATWVKGQGITEDGSSPTDGLSGVGMGDPELEAKARLFGQVRDPFVIGAALFGTAPLGSATAEGRYIGDSSPTFGLRAIFDGASGPLSVGGNLSGVYRGAANVGTTELGPEFRYGVGVGFKLSPVVRLVADGFGSTKFSAKNGTNALEADAGIQIFPLGSPIVVHAGAGTGVIQGVGVPAVRGFLGIMYVHEPRDQDGDGIYDDVDQCPTEPEDFDGFEDSDGCPDLDNDGDMIMDVDDLCPNEPEDFDGFEDTDGCPDHDNDKDGIPDTHDQCPNEPETFNGYKDEDGCPDEPDRDNDGVPDSRDLCPDEPEDTDGFEDTDGCPDPDNDGDGIPDIADECIDEPETFNGYMDEDGCPDEVPKR
jgi:OmpA-OmpF porin, OOP family